MEAGSVAYVLKMRFYVKAIYSMETGVESGQLIRWLRELGARGSAADSADASALAIASSPKRQPFQQISQHGHQKYGRVGGVHLSGASQRRPDGRQSVAENSFARSSQYQADQDDFKHVVDNPVLSFLMMNERGTVSIPEPVDQSASSRAPYHSTGYGYDDDELDDSGLDDDMDEFESADLRSHRAHRSGQRPHTSSSASEKPQFAKFRSSFPRQRRQSNQAHDETSSVEPRRKWTGLDSKRNHMLGFSVPIRHNRQKQALGVKVRVRSCLCQRRFMQYSVSRIGRLCLAFFAATAHPYNRSQARSDCNAHTIPAVVFCGSDGETCGRSCSGETLCPQRRRVPSAPVGYVAQERSRKR